MNSIKKYSPHLLLAFLVILGIGLRLYDLTDAPIDFHPTRQLRGAIVARGIYYSLLSQTDEGTRQLAEAFSRSVGQYEPPILESLVALSWLLVGEENFWVARILSSLFWAVGGVALYLAARKLVNLSFRPENTWLADISAAIVVAYYFVLPFSVQASRSFQPDPMMVMWLSLFVYAILQWSVKPDWWWAVGCGVFGGLAILTKAVAIYPVAVTSIGMLFYSALHSTKWESYSSNKLKRIFKSLTNPQVLLMAVMMLMPSLLFYFTQEGRASEYFSSWTISLSHLLLEPTLYLRWANLLGETMGIIPIIAGIAGLFTARLWMRPLLLGLWGGYLAYGLFLPYQMYTHNYYHLMVIPILAISMLPIVYHLVRLVNKQNSWIQIGFATIGILTIVFYSRISIVNLSSKDYHNEEAYWQEIASLLPQDGKIIALTQDYGMRLMYYGWRKVTLWPNRGEQKLSKLRGSEKEFETYFQKRIEGKSYFLITSFRQFEDQPQLKEFLYNNYPLYAEGSNYLIFDLRSPYEQPTGQE